MIIYSVYQESHLNRYLKIWKSFIQYKLYSNGVLHLEQQLRGDFQFINMIHKFSMT